MTNETGVDDAAPNEATDEPSGNLSIEELSSILGAEASEGESESDENETPTSEEETLEEPEETTGEEEEETEEEDEPQMEPEDQESDEPDHETDVLSKYNLDLEAIPEEDAKAINKLLGGRLHKRLNQQHAKLKAAEEALEEYKRDNPKSEASSNSLTDVNNLDDLLQKERDLNKYTRNVDKVLRQEDQIDDDGNEYLYEEDGKKYTRQEVESWLDNTEKQLDAIPERRKFLAEKEQAEKQADQLFPELSDPDNPYSERYEALQQDPKYAAVFNTMPNAKYVAGLLFLGERTLQNALQKPKVKSKPAAKKVKPKTSPAPEGIAPKKSSSTAKKQKSIEKAKNNLAESGSLDNLAKLFME